MKTAAILLGAASLGAAYPGLMGASSKEDVLRSFEKRDAEPSQHEKRLLGLDILPSVGSLVNTVNGLSRAVAAEVNQENLRPQPGYDFQAPGPNDSRGPCPGLNLLANYGYLPRDGYVNFGQVVAATAEGFNMGPGLSSVLSLFAVLTDGDIESESWYLGAGPGEVGGLNRHSTVEADVSPNREDYYLGCGNNHALSSRLFKQNVAFAAQDPDQEFSLNVMGNQYAAQAKFSQTYNPYIYYFPFPSIVSLGAFAFYPRFFSNGTYLAGGVANYESISSIIGAKLDETTGEFEYVPEQWPENWYRSATPYDVPQLLVDILTTIYPKYLLPMAVPQLGSENLEVQTIMCNFYMGIQSIMPLMFAPDTADAAAAITWALDKLAAVGLSDTILGCPNTSYSNLYPNATQEGGPLAPPPAVLKNAGNNVYNKVYFTEAPTTPQCNPSQK